MTKSSLRRSDRTLTKAQTQRIETTTNPYSSAFAALDEDNDVLPVEGTKCEIHMYERRYNSRGEAVLLQSGSRSDFSRAEEDFVDAALVLTRYYSINRDLETSRLEIKSPYIRAALKAVVGSYPGVNINSSGPILINDAPRCLFHYRAELQKYASKSRDKKVKEHIKFCLEYMKKILAREISSYEELMQNGDAPPGLEFQNLWMAFKPGSLLYAKGVHKVFGICRLRAMTMNSSSERPDYWDLQLEVINSDGEDFRYCHHGIKINKFDGYRPLAEMEIFPLEYHQEKERVTQLALEMGKKYVSLLGIHHMRYEGMAKVKERIIIDEKEYYNNNGDFGKISIPDSKVFQSQQGDHLKMSSEELLVCPPLCYGFTLGTKRWMLFYVADLQPVEYNKDAFQSLMLAEGLKKMLSSLVKLQVEKTAQFDDLIVGKGKGLIILLHGAPGVGKTFTAESIADYSERPLYTLSKSDFGNYPFATSDKLLSSSLARASKWNSIVLLDEADVFMQERSGSEMFRNEQVSVLLRILEYFEGTLILTTNRVGTIDAAFKSRIHLCLTYPPLSAKARSGLWKTFILKATASEHPCWLDTKFLKKVSAKEINGREIKNIVRVAHALAVNDKRPLSSEDILQGLQYLKDFERDFSKAGNKRKIVEGNEMQGAKRARRNNVEVLEDESGPEMDE
ncbi:P-loop containing nucleoside triphosphate hydrolase protein [Acephala macrosclerotiorum]|nr:P-loop containing nucleoside triphosphate hydrolase protein [Acephala macrosclerotiorum]